MNGVDRSPAAGGRSERPCHRLRSPCGARGRFTRSSSPRCSVDAVLVVPVQPVQHDVVAASRFARQHRRQQDAVVVRMRLGAEDRDVRTGRARSSADSSMRAHAGHAVADDDESGFAHVGCSVVVSPSGCHTRCDERRTSLPDRYRWQVPQRCVPLAFEVSPSCQFLRGRDACGTALPLAAALRLCKERFLYRNMYAIGQQSL